MSDKAEAMASLARQLEERVQDDALTPVTLSVEHAAELLESLRKPKPWERCSIHGPAEDRVWACPACLVELRTEVEALRADAERECMRRALHDIAEEWAGAECGEPVYAQEAYAIELAKRMYALAVKGLLYTAPPAERGHVVVTRTQDGHLAAVTRQDDEHRILSVVADTNSLRERIAALEAALEQARVALESCTEGDYTTGHVIHPSFNERLVDAALRKIEEVRKC